MAGVKARLPGKHNLHQQIARIGHNPSQNGAIEQSKATDVFEFLGSVRRILC
jgi:hypothetical protein